MANSGLPYFPFYVNDFASDGKVESMSTLAVGSYILLLCKAWREEPPASVPAHDPTLAKWARLTLDQWLGIKSEVLAAFSLGTDLRWHQKRLRREYDKLTCLKNHKSEVGRSAAKSRWMKNKHANALRTHNQRNANGMPSEYESVSESSSSLKNKKKANYEDVKAFCSELNLPESDSEYLFNHWEGNGWTNGGKPIRDWQRTIRAWKSARHLPSQKNGLFQQQSMSGTSPGITLEDLRARVKSK